jgi:hypothetical protein
MSTKKQTVKKLPKGLRKLPPVPFGYSAWKYVGQGYKSKKAECFAHGSERMGWDIEECDKAIGDTCTSLHYLIAIKRPAPKQPRAKAVKAGYKLTVTVTGAVSSRSAAMTKVLCAFASRKPDGCVFDVKPLGLIPKRKAK